MPPQGQSCNNLLIFQTYLALCHLNAQSISYVNNCTANLKNLINVIYKPQNIPAENLNVIIDKTMVRNYPYCIPLVENFPSEIKDYNIYEKTYNSLFTTYVITVKVEYLKVCRPLCLKRNSWKDNNETSYFIVH